MITALDTTPNIFHYIRGKEYRKNCFAAIKHERNIEDTHVKKSSSNEGHVDNKYSNSKPSWKYECIYSSKLRRVYEVKPLPGTF